MDRIRFVMVLCVCCGLALWVLPGCPDPQQACPPPLLPKDILSHELDNSFCCAALAICCKELSGEDKTRCEKDVAAGGDVTCQSDYHEFTSFEKCKPVYVRDHPQLKPNHPEP